MAALNGLGNAAERAKIILIVGGEGKGQDFSPLSDAVARHAKAVILIGRDAPLIKQVLANTGVSLIDANTLEVAVQEANKLAVSGDIILLSPACASFDMFKDYAHRAQVFIDAISELAILNGQVSA